MKNKLPSDASYVNAGIYLSVTADAVSIYPDVEAVSLERELLPRWLREGRKIKGFIYSGACVDIGTPERYRLAQNAAGGC